MTDLLARLDAWKPFTALVVGDFILDELVYGDAERLSPDAPVPVLLVKRREHRPGGAANVCMDLAALHARVIAIGVTGDDAPGRILREKLRAMGVDPAGLIADATRPTTLKQNLIGLAQARHPQKMFRVDEESREPVSPGVHAALFAAFERHLASADVVIIEDYAKGVCGEELCASVIAAARKAGKPVFVDPAPSAPAARYRGATVATPNFTEALKLAGRGGGASRDGRALEDLGRSLMRAMDMACMVLTLDKDGAMLLEGDAAPG